MDDHKKPAYVPGFDWDLFISYATPTDVPSLGRKTGWVTQLKEDLEKYLAAETAPEPKVWMDDSDLRKTGKYSDEIAGVLTRSALLLTINCEPYRDSEFCQWEVSKFREACGTKVTTESGSRIIEVFRSLLSGGNPPGFQPDSTGVWFCGNPRKREPEGTFEVGSEEYRSAFLTLFREVRKLLLSMRKERRWVFLSPPDTDPQSTVGGLYHRYRNQLRRVYTVEPSPGGSSADSELISGALISIHFLSTRLDRMTTNRIALAMQSARPMLVIVGPDLLLDRNNTNWSFVKVLKQRLNEPLSNTAALRIIEWVPGRNQPDDLMGEINALIPPPVVPRPARSSVYLICDPQDTASEELRELHDILMSLMQVEMQPSRHSFNGAQDHADKLTNCDSALVAWGHADEDWFMETIGELGSARGFRRGRAFESEAVCLLKPESESKSKVSALREVERREIVDLANGLDLLTLARLLAALKVEMPSLPLPELNRFFEVLKIDYGSVEISTLNQFLRSLRLDVASIPLSECERLPALRNLIVFARGGGLSDVAQAGARV